MIEHRRDEDQFLVFAETSNELSKPSVKNSTSLISRGKVILAFVIDVERWMEENGKKNLFSILFS